MKHKIAETFDQDRIEQQKEQWERMLVEFRSSASERKEKFQRAVSRGAEELSHSIEKEIVHVKEEVRHKADEMRHKAGEMKHKAGEMKDEICLATSSIKHSLDDLITQSPPSKRKQVATDRLTDNENLPGLESSSSLIGDPGSLRSSVSGSSTTDHTTLTSSSTSTSSTSSSSSSSSTTSTSSSSHTTPPASHTSCSSPSRNTAGLSSASTGVFMRMRGWSTFFRNITPI
ncbi:unnamed protein product [Amoebophrya sp. A25]|nr:unnamed protein product [Amoebophrya sp. A25]|eukprot:GSA25T00003542001.1